MIDGHDLGGIAARGDLALLEQHRGIAQLLDGGQVVRDEQDRHPAGAEIVDTAETLRLELRVAHGEHLVDQEHVRLEMRGDREPQPHVHARRVPLDRRVEERLDPRELDDARQLRRDLPLAHAENGAAQEHVLPSRELGVEAGPDLDERGEAAVDRDAAAGRRGDAGQQLQQRALARAVRADDAERGAARHVERHVAQRPERLRVAADAAAVLLRDVLQAHVDGHIESAIVRSCALKYT